MSDGLVPDTEPLRLAFTAEVTRTQRRSDDSFSLEGLRFEVPSRDAHLHRLTGRYASWDRSFVHLADPTTGVILGRLCPQDKTQNAQGRRLPSGTPTPRRKTLLRNFRPGSQAQDIMNTLPVQRASLLATTGPQTQWLIEGLWADQAVGILLRPAVPTPPAHPRSLDPSAPGR